MSRFYAAIVGSRGQATRQGTIDSGMFGHIRGWHVGADVRCHAEKDVDVVSIGVTGGSSGGNYHSILKIRSDEQIENVSTREWRGRRYVTIRIAGGK